ncbi:hypothetical protein DVH24_038403 [Malus domestica]|uniref:Plant bHLH transcription factor ACT-like domain-containing protein n=1 Tax=Malus domestica TaxID=3750 RepID=A0A498K772_MALDO|nr:hypothetical protein DVH24_038403 [Malus domestica]
MVSKVQMKRAPVSKKLLTLRSISKSHAQLKVEAREEGFLIKMFSEKSCSGLLVFVLEAFEELGLDVHQARVSCSNNFLLEAVGTINDNQSAEQKDVEVVKEAMLQAIQNWSEVSQQQE